MRITGVTAMVFMIGLLSATSTLAGSDVSGTWDLEMTWNGGEATSTGTCTFKQDGVSLTGTCGGGSDKFPITGQTSGSRLSWQFDVKQDGSQGRMEFTGELDQRGTTIRGSCSIVGAQDGTFTTSGRSSRPP